MTLVGRGQLRGASRPLLLTPLLAGAAGVVLSIGLWIGDPDGRAEGSWPSVFVVLLFVACGAASFLYFFVAWALLPARVRYYVDGTELIVFRGRRTVKQLDLVDAELIRVDGWVTTRRLYLGLGSSSPLADLPHVVCTMRTASGRSRTESFPRVLIWGRDGADAFRERLTEELLAAGIEPTVFETGHVGSGARQDSVGR